MKKYIYLCLVILLSICTSYADEFSSDDLWSNWNNSIENEKQNKQVSDEKFNQTVDKLIEKKNKRINKKKIPKGNELHQSDETEAINKEFDANILPVVSLPVELIYGEKILPVGHYQLKASKEEGKVFIELYQGNYQIAKFPAIETSDDFGEDLINYAKWEENSADSIKLICGSLDMNVYTIIKFHVF